MSRPLILFDLTRLLSASGRSAPTGIERVEFAYARWLSGLPREDVRFVITMPGAVRLIADGAVPAFLDRQADVWERGAQGFPAAQAIHNVNDFLAGDAAPRPPHLGHVSVEERAHRKARRVASRRSGNSRFSNWAREMASAWAREALSPLLRQAQLKRPVVYLRASLDRLERPEPVERLKSAGGVAMICLCHDAIPIDFPEFVRPTTVMQCASRYKTVAAHADGLIATSRYCADRVAPLLGRRTPPMLVSHIGCDASVPVDPDLPPLLDEPYFLVVSTIEARKNHALLFNVWRRMAADLGSAAPKLIVAGKRGWEAQSPIAMLDRATDLSNHVYEAGAVPDGALAVLRRHATAVLMPSFVEGFGMPVTEALCCDTPVIASDIPVFREIVGHAAELIDPLDGPAWMAAILDYATPGSRRRAAAVDHARAFRPPGWSDHFAAVRPFLEEVGDRARVPTTPRRTVRLASATASPSASARTVF
ncbi:glycosyltransferase family 4 protein [Acuticoccus sp.]|uniref:glycosyltransferase family 4 protein n=1 Tax=Acuticoccus sp. TaxID=1904378 RepID=UPI003B52FC72